MSKYLRHGGRDRPEPTYLINIIIQVNIAKSDSIDSGAGGKNADG